jgi:cardiolipin synthase
MTQEACSRRERVRLVLRTVLITALAIILVANLWPGEIPAGHEIDAFYEIEDAEFVRNASHLFGHPLVEGNHIDTLVNGKSLEAMLEAVRSAAASVTFESYVFAGGAVADRFVSAFIDAARRGVKVHVLLDWFGSTNLESEAIAAMTEAGVSVHRYHRPVWYNLDKLNNRTHRKILVVDGRIGFIGGVGIGDQWLGDGSRPEEWRDTQFRVEGPVVAQLQTAFLDNWHKVDSEVLHGPAYFPPLQPRGEALAQVIESTAETGSESVRLSFLLSIAAARKRILIGNAYFVPDALAIEALVKARSRGVEVEVIVPGPVTDTPSLRRASRSGFEPLLRAGVEIHEYQPTMYHCKVMVVDDLWTLVGSSSFDNRSFAFNDEANLNVWDHAFAKQQTRIFEEDRKRSRTLTLDDWRNRPAWERVLGYLTSYFNRQL